MKKQIILDQQNINYTLKTSPRARHMRLALYADGNFVVTRPQGLGENLVERFIQEKANWILKKISQVNKFSGVYFSRDKKTYLANKAAALLFVQNKVQYFNQYYHVIYHNISVRNQKTCWGSCTKSRNLSFNYKISYLPEALADYIIVHELCHLKEFNHSPKFWQLVGKTIPDYQARRKTLKQGFRL